MVKPIPDRWADYKPIGGKIEGTRFIAFKVPLRERVSAHVKSEMHLDNVILLKRIPNLGLIIDLTNTDRYYNPGVFEKKGIEYKKLAIPGHLTPRKDLTDQFFKIVKEFMENNEDNDKLIGVHCTHGVNRTGYLICKYMISQMTVEPTVAMDRFANARGHQIERKNYIEDLHIISKSTEIKIENWRATNEDLHISKLPERKIENWRATNEDLHISKLPERKIENWKASNVKSPYKYRQRSTSFRRRSPSSTNNSHSSNCTGTNDGLSHHIPSDLKTEGCIYGSPNVEQLNICNAMPYRPPQLRTDYYLTRPQRNLKRYKYVRKPDDL